MTGRKYGFNCLPGLRNTCTSMLLASTECWYGGRAGQALASPPKLTRPPKLIRRSSWWFTRGEERWTGGNHAASSPALTLSRHKCRRREEERKREIQTKEKTKLEDGDRLAPVLPRDDPVDTAHVLTRPLTPPLLAPGS